MAAVEAGERLRLRAEFHRPAEGRGAARRSPALGTARSKRRCAARTLQGDPCRRLFAGEETGNELAGA